MLVLGIIGTFVLSLTSSPPGNLGVRNGRLAKAPSSPNCVSTQAAERSHWIEPMAFQCDPSTAMDTLEAIVGNYAGGTIIEREGDYLYAEFRSPFFRFVDDVEFLIEPESNRIHFRSASRVGHSDLGANRNRMEQIRNLFAEADQPARTPNPTTVAEPAMSK